jgi:hypothetical protein
MALVHEPFGHRQDPVLSEQVLGRLDRAELVHQADPAAGRKAEMFDLFDDDLATKLELPRE